MRDRIKKIHVVVFSLVLLIMSVFIVVYYDFFPRIDAEQKADIEKVSVMEKTDAIISPSIIETDLLINTPTIIHCTIQNVGSKPLIIQHVSSDCGCLAVHWEKTNLIEKDSSTLLSLRVTPGNTGYFSKKIFVFCNTNNSPLPVHVKGRVSEN